LSSRFELVAEDPLQYPAVPSFGEAPGYRIKAGELAKLIRRTIFAAATENTRYALNSVMIEFEGTKLNLVATDGRRLALMSGSVEGGGPPPAGTTLLPPKTVGFLQKVLHDPEEMVEIIARENEVHFRTQKVAVYSRLVEGRFPKYTEVFPREINQRIPLSVEPLYGKVRQARIVTNEDSKGVVFRFNDGNLTMESRSAEFGQSEVKTPVAYTGPEIAITYDPDFLIDALRVLEPERELTLEVVDSKRASVLRSDDGFAYVIMPLTKDR
jgi:DNA polymerase-3 subunit beta